MLRFGGRHFSWREIGLEWAVGPIGRGLRWRSAPPCPEARYDAGGAQVGRWLFVIAGYGSLDEVIGHADVLDLVTWRWVDRIRIPDAMAHTHSAIASDGKRHMRERVHRRFAEDRFYTGWGNIIEKLVDA